MGEWILKVLFGKLKKYFPHLPTFLVLKSLLFLPFLSLFQRAEVHGPVFIVDFNTEPIVVLCGHDAVKEALADLAEAVSWGAVIQGSGVLQFGGMCLGL